MRFSLAIRISAAYACIVHLHNCEYLEVPTYLPTS